MYIYIEHEIKKIGGYFFDLCKVNWTNNFNIFIYLLCKWKADGFPNQFYEKNPFCFY